MLVAGCALAFSAVASISLPILLLGGLAAAVVVAARDRIRMPEMRRPFGPLADAVVIVLLLLAIPNIAIFAAGGGAGQALQTGFIQFHQNLFLGPTNQVLAGDALLVDTLSQYGVGSIYFLAGIFNLIPIGNETLGLVEGVLSALMFIGAWTVMRIAGVSRLLAAAAMFVAVVALVYGLQYPLGGLLQHGAFRFGLPIGVVVGAVAEARWPNHQRSARALQVGTVALASIWALEGFAYSVFTVMVVAALIVWLAPAGERRGEAVRWIVQLLAACVAAHVLLAAVTLAARGELPEWGWYLNTLREFLFGRIGDLTYDFSQWSPGVALGALYLVSASALLVMLRRRPELALKERATVVAIAAMTAFGVALLSYVVNRGSDHIIAYVCTARRHARSALALAARAARSGAAVAGQARSPGIRARDRGPARRSRRLVGRRPLPPVGPRLCAPRRRLALGSLRPCVEPAAAAARGDGRRRVARAVHAR